MIDEPKLPRTPILPFLGGAFASAVFSWCVLRGARARGLEFHRTKKSLFPLPSCRSCTKHAQWSFMAGPFPLRHCGHLPSSQSMAPRKSKKPGWMFGILGAQPLCSPLFWLFGSMFIRSEGAKDYNYECKQNRRSESARVLAVWTGCFCGSFYGELSMNPVPKHFWTGSLKGGSMHSDSERNNVVLPTRQQLENSAISGPSSPPLCSPGPNECRSRMFRLFPCPLHLLLIFTQECLHSPKAT